MITHTADSQLQEEVLREMKGDPTVDVTNIGVAVKDSVVSLTGDVPSYAEKLAAEKAALRVDGVKAVANDLKVRLPGESKRTDADIAADVVKALNQSVSVPKRKITATVSDGWVTLEGVVDWGYQKNAAAAAVERVLGVKGVVNNISVKPVISPEDLRAHIEVAFKRVAELDAKHITIEVDGGHVALRGAVRSWAERDEAAREAWAAPGVVSVENVISVEP